MSPVGVITWRLCKGEAPTQGHQSCSPREAFQGQECPTPSGVVIKPRTHQVTQPSAFPPFLLYQSYPGPRKAVESRGTMGRLGWGQRKYHLEPGALNLNCKPSSGRKADSEQPDTHCLGDGMRNVATQSHTHTPTLTRTHTRPFLPSQE